MTCSGGARTILAMAPHPLDGAFERVKRAGEHIEDLHRRILALTDAQQRTVLDSLDPETIRNVSMDTEILPFDLNVDTVTVPLDFGVLIGECCYNLRAALDYLIYELAINDSGRVQENTQFPIEGSQEFFSKATRSRLRGLSCAHVADIERFQPYKGCDWTSDLKAISNLDKHRKLTATPAHRLSFLFLSHQPPGAYGGPGALGPARRVEHSSGRDVFVYFPLNLTITLSGGAPIIETLRVIKLRVAETLEAFKPEFKR